ncbi:hypothetical protein K6959_02410 [Bacillus aquiflavi]|uniref:hypothetical protein n=1 Tax=Bacillus aquiflavi TaxID=2672567 RepID=UPI001CAA1C97|nr:hypothetical protein [Bacillus aquiflavi]UAC48824.1 hypothetical protein K6959_02410 [Bacillus aquiflavi]
MGSIELLTQLGEPKEPDLFWHLTVGQMQIFVEKGLDFKENRLSISLSSFFFLKNIRVNGLKRF